MAVVVTASVMPVGGVWAKASLKGELYELRFALEPKRSVDDELPDIVKTPVNSQNAAWVRMLRDRSSEDVCGEFGREVGERRHDETPVSSSALRRVEKNLTGKETEIIYKRKPPTEKSSLWHGVPVLDALDLGWVQRGSKPGSRAEEITVPSALPLQLPAQSPTKSTKT